MRIISARNGQVMKTKNKVYYVDLNCKEISQVKFNRSINHLWRGPFSMPNLQDLHIPRKFLIIDIHC